MVSIIVKDIVKKEGLIRCVNSILRQSYQNIEILLLYDKNDDSILKIINDYSIKNENIVHVVEGVEGALTKAKGEYFFFCNSTDTASPNGLSVLYKIIHEKNAQLVAGGYCFLNHIGKFESAYENFYDIITIDSPQNRENFIQCRPQIEYCLIRKNMILNQFPNYPISFKCIVKKIDTIYVTSHIAIYSENLLYMQQSSSPRKILIAPVTIRKPSTFDSPEQIIGIFGTGQFGMKTILKSMFAWIRFKMKKQ